MTQDELDRLVEHAREGTNYVLNLLPATERNKVGVEECVRAVPELVAEVKRLRHVLTGIAIMPSRSSDGFAYSAQDMAIAMRDAAHKALDGAK